MQRCAKGSGGDHERWTTDGNSGLCLRIQATHEHKLRSRLDRVLDHEIQEPSDADLRRFERHEHGMGLHKSTSIGEELLQSATSPGLVLLNKQDAKARAAPDAKQQGTTPDLTWVTSYIVPDTWGSDHHPTEIEESGAEIGSLRKREAKTIS